MELTSYKQILSGNDVALAVITDGRRFIFVNGGESITGFWPLNSSKQFNKVIVFHSGENGNIYIGDYIDSTPAQNIPNKYNLHFVNSRLAGRAIVDWTKFTHGKNPGYSRIYLQGDTFNPPPKGKQNPIKKIISVEDFERDVQVKEWILNEAKGKCESCEKIPFLASNRVPFLEVHHVKRLADGGSDTVNNTVAICSDCHRELHYGLYRSEKTENLYNRVKRLIRE